MVDIKAMSASEAYADALKRQQEMAKAGVIGDDAGAETDGLDFATMLRDVAQGAIETTRGGEVAAVPAATQDSELADVIIALTNAEITLETVVAVRDKVVEAYQQIIRMPI